VTTRRQFLLGGAAAAGVLPMPAIVTRSLAAPAVDETAPLRGNEFLNLPDFDALAGQVERVARVRPHRDTGVNLKLEDPIDTPRGRKFIIHNYGHSGAGITLSWGCAAHVVKHVQTVLTQLRGTGVQPSVAILGTGVIGLTSATELRRMWTPLPITVYAKTLDVTQTTSYFAGGQFAPSQIWQEYRHDKATLADYLTRSAARIAQIQYSGRRQSYGVAMRKNYMLDFHDEAFNDYTPCKLVPAYRRGKLPFRPLNDIGREYSTWLMNPRVLLPQLVLDLKAARVRFKAKEFTGLPQVHDLTENIIINCTGYGAKALFNDPKVKPHRGHLAVLKNPAALTYFFSGGSKNDAVFYMFARQTDIVLGGTVFSSSDDRDFFDTSAGSKDTEITDRIIENARRMFTGRADQCMDARDGSIPHRSPDPPEHGRCYDPPPTS
jgi:glycine/D-amino acid oxidase-like deaminating enzyme